MVRKDADQIVVCVAESYMLLTLKLGCSEKMQLFCFIVIYDFPSSCLLVLGEKFKFMSNPI